MGSLFRKEAVENYKEQFFIDRQVAKMAFSTKFLVLMFLIVFILLVVWFIFGNIVNTVNGTGVVYPTAGFENITVSNSGMLSEITVNVGDNVEVGDIVAILPKEDILNKIKEAVSTGKDAATIEKLRQDYYNESVIVSKYKGKVISIYKDGAYVNTGDTIVTIAASKSDSNQRQICAFFPTSQKNSINIGSAVQISPNYAPREKFGYINGYVADIGKSIITKNNLEKDFESYGITSILDENETYIAVYINLLSNPDSKSGLDWSERNSGDIDVEAGTICDTSIVVLQQPPYKWLIGGGA